MAGGINQYGYAGGDPVNNSDPFGLFPLVHLSSAVASAVKKDADAVTLEQMQEATLDAIEFVMNEITTTGVARGAASLASSGLFRSGRANPGNLAPPRGEAGLSVRTSLSNPIDSKSAPVFPAGGHVTEIDVSRLPAGSVRIDNTPPGHAEIVGTTAEQVNGAVVNTKKLP